MDDLRRVTARLPSGSFAPDVDEEPAAVRGARDDLGAAPTDEEAAAEARRRYKSEGMARIPPDPAIAPLLAPGEDVLAIRRGVGFDRRPTSPGRASAGRGDLYLTSARLILLGQPVVYVRLPEIQEAMMSDDRLLLVMSDGAGLALDADQPRLLRVEISAARAAARATAHP